MLRLDQEYVIIGVTSCDSREMSFSGERGDQSEMSARAQTRGQPCRPQYFDTRTIPKNNIHSLLNNEYIKTIELY